MFNYIKLRYRMKKITAADVWAYVDSGVLTAEEAEMICGARPA